MSLRKALLPQLPGAGMGLGRHASRPLPRDGVVLVALCMWGSYVALSPLYLWASGLPQMADILLALSMVGYWAFNGGMHLPRRGRDEAYLLLMFICVAWVVSAVHAVIHKPDMLMDAVRLSFNILVFIFVLELAGRAPRRFIQLTLFGLFGAYLVILNSDLSLHSGRETGSFNNPNQLGYMGVLCMAYVTLALWWGVFWTWAISILALIIVVTGLLGISFAAIACLSMASAIYLVVFALKPSTARRKVLTALGIVLLMVLAVLLNRGFDVGARQVDWVENNVINPLSIRYERRASSKLESKVEGLSSGEERGFAIFSVRPDLMFLGAGRGGNKRYVERNEIHASLPAVLYSYGFLGMFLFCGAFALIHLKSSLLALVVVMPIWAWSFAHYGLNFPLFWGLMAFLAIGGADAAVRRQATVQEPRFRVRLGRPSQQMAPTTRQG